MKIIVLNIYEGRIVIIKLKSICALDRSAMAEHRLRTLMATR